MSHYLRSVQSWLKVNANDSATIVWDKQNPISLAFLRREVATLHRRLIEQPVTRVALYFEDHYSFVIALLACLYAKKIPVLLGHSKLSRILLEHSHYDLLLIAHQLDTTINYEVFQPSITPEFTDDRLPDLDLQQTIELFTSGSSGHPKKVIKTLQQMDDESTLIAPLFQGRMADCYLLTSVPPCHLYGLTFTLWLPLALGIPVNRKKISFPEEFAAVHPHQSYVFVTSPAFLKRIDETLPSPPTSLVISAGGDLDHATVMQVTSWLGLGIDEIYGSTETGAMAHRYRQGTEQPWRCLPGLHFTSSEKGWLLRSPLIKEETGLALSDELSFVDNHYFHLIGRLSRLIKLEEKRISLDDIERQLLTLDGIIDAAVITVPIQRRQRIAALIVMTPALQQQWRLNRASMECHWRQALGAYLEDIAMPRYWRAVTSIPRDSLHKRQDSRLKELFFETR